MPGCPQALAMLVGEWDSKRKGVSGIELVAF